MQAVRAEFGVLRADFLTKLKSAFPQRSKLPPNRIWPQPKYPTRACAPVGKAPKLEELFQYAVPRYSLRVHTPGGHSLGA